MLHNVLESAGLLADATRSFNDQCAVGIEPNMKVIQRHLDESLMLVTALTPHIGYEKAADIALKAHREDISLKEAAVELGYVEGADFDKWVRPEDMTHPFDE
jgi:fumarate hydratase class II